MTNSLFPKNHLTPALLERPFDILAIGKPKVEQIVKVDRWPQWGSQHGQPVEHIEHTVGGCGATVSCITGRLGGKASLIARLGMQKYGEDVLSELERSGVNFKYVNKVHDLEGSLLIILTNEQGDWYSLSHVNDELIVSMEDLPPEDIFRDYKFLYIDGFTFKFQSEKTAVERAIKIGRDNGALVCIDAAVPTALNQPDYLRYIFSQCNIGFANQLESQVITKTDSVEEAVNAFKSFGTGLYIIKQGDEGSYIVNDESVFFVPSFKVQVVDTIGAGDAYVATMLLALARNESFQSAALLGSAAGSLACLGHGSLSYQYGLEDIQRLVAENKLSIKEC